MLVVALEFLGYLLPESLQLFKILRLVFLGGHIPVLVVSIEYHIETVAYTIIHYLMYACHPFGVNLVAAVHMLAPRNGYPYYIKARVLQQLEHINARSSCLPVRFCAESRVSRGVHGVAEVPAYLYLFKKLL